MQCTVLINGAIVLLSNGDLDKIGGCWGVSYLTKVNDPIVLYTPAMYFAQFIKTTSVESSDADISEWCIV